MGFCATPAAYGVTAYDVMGDPPFDGAVHEIVADASPDVAMTEVGAAGAVGAADDDLRTRTAASHGVPAPVPNVADTVAPAFTI